MYRHTVVLPTASFLIHNYFNECVFVYREAQVYIDLHIDLYTYIEIKS